MSPSSSSKLLGLLQASCACRWTSSLFCPCMSVLEGRSLEHPGPSSSQGGRDFQQDITPNGHMRVSVGACCHKGDSGAFGLGAHSHHPCSLPRGPATLCLSSLRVAPSCAFFGGLHQ